MFDRSLFKALMLIGIALPIASCTSSPSLTSIVVTPATMNFGGPGLTTQLTATGYYTHPDHPAKTENITNQVSWASATPACVTVSSTGLITSGANVCSNIPVTASAPGFDGLISGSMIVNVTQPNGSGGDIVSVLVIPATQSVASLGVSVQYEAVGTTAGGATVALTNYPLQLKWVSSNVSVATIGAATGLATTVGGGTSTITATFTNADGSGAIGSAILTVAPSGSPEPLTSLTVSPNTQAASAAGQTAQFLAIATTGTGTSVNLTNQGAIVNGQSIKAAVWTSSNPSVASINSATGVASSLSVGATVITAIATNPDGSVVTGTSTYTVGGTGTTTAEPLASLAILPATQTALAANQTAHFIAIGTTGSGATVNLTNQSAIINGATIKAAVWSSSNPSVATIDPATGIATALSAGATAIVAIASNPDGTVVTGTAVYTVTVSSTTEPLASLAVVPSSQTALAVNQTAHFIAIGTTGSGATVNLTNQPATVNGATIKAAVWSSSSPAVATVDPATGIATALSAGATAITAIVTNPDGTVVTGTAVYTVAVSSSNTTEPLASLAIVPGTQTALAVNQTANFIAIGTTGAGATVNLTNQSATINGKTIAAAVWSSSNPSVATVNAATGVATALSAGATAIVAIATNPDGTVVTGTAVYTVTVPSVTEAYVSLAIVPASQTATTVNQTAQFIAIGTTGTGTTVNLTNAATWGSSTTSVATIGPATGLATALSTGATAITAVVKNPSNDGTVVTGSASFTVAISGTPEPLVSLSIQPSTQSVAAAGETAQFLAIGDFSPSSSTPGEQNMANISSYTVNWYSSNPQVAAVNLTTGLVTGVGPGTTAITAIATNNADKSGATAAATFTVTGPAAEPISALSIFPGTQSIALPLAGSPLQTATYIAIGTNGTTGLQTNVTTQVAWSSTNPQVATISSGGVATALSQGTTTITAIATNLDKSVVTATAALTVTAAVAEPLLSIAILPPTQSVAAPGLTSQLIAIGTFSAAPVTQDVTKGIGSYPIAIKWSSSNTAVATVGSPEKAGTTPGLVTAVGQGTVAIVAVASNPDGTLVTATETFTVVGGSTEQITALQIIPSNQAATAPAQTNQFIALGTEGSNGLQYDVTSQVAWKSATPSVATICSTVAPVSCPTTPGLITALATGSTAITATWTNLDHSQVVAQASYSVTIGPAPEPLLSITIVPTTISVGQILDTGQFLAFGTFSSTPTYEDITNGIFHVGFAGCTTAPCTTAAPVTWISSSPNVFPINTTGIPGDPAGVATAYGEGTDVVIAEASNPDGTLVTALGTFTCPIDQCGPPISTQLATLTIYTQGAGTDWTVTDNTTVIHCSGAGNPGYSTSVCEANFPIGATVTLTETPTSPTTFGGWSANCETALDVPNTTPTCTVQLTTSETVGAIFN